MPRYTGVAASCSHSDQPQHLHCSSPQHSVGEGVWVWEDRGERGGGEEERSIERERGGGRMREEERSRGREGERT